MSRTPSRILVLLGGLLLGATAASAATLTIQFSNGGKPLEDPKQGKFYVYELGEREQYLAWGHQGKSVRVPDGNYDIVIKYLNDRIERERVWENVRLSGSVERSVDFDIAVAHLTVQVTVGGEPVPSYAGRFSVHRAGRRGEPLASKRPGQTLTISPGVYDVEVAYRAPDGLKAVWLENYRISSYHDETVELGAGGKRVRLTLVRQGEPLLDGRWILYPAGQRERPLAQAGSGESRTVPEGRYDIGLFHGDGAERGERWLRDVEVRGDLDRKVEVGGASSLVRVDVRHDGVAVRDAWFAIYPAGDREATLQVGRSGTAVDLPPGNYDIGAFLRRGGLRAEAWRENLSILEPTELDVELQFEAASLRVEPTRRQVRRSEDEQSNLLILVDSSTAMNGTLGGKTYLELVRENIDASVDVFTGTQAGVGLRVFGITPRSQNDCRDSTLLVPPQRLDRRDLDRALRLLRPAGHSPIAHSLDRIAGDFPDGGDNSVLLFTASVDDCGGNACTAAARLLHSGRVSRIDVIALGVDRGRAHELECIGNYHEVRSVVDLRSAVLDVLRQARRGSEGTVAIFEPGWSTLVATGNLRERLDVVAGTYDVQVRVGDETFEWEGLRIRGAMEARAGQRAPR